MFDHTAGVAVLCEDLPELHNTVTLDPDLKDSDGIPAAKINYTLSENSQKMLAHGLARAEEVMEAAGSRYSQTLRGSRRSGSAEAMPCPVCAVGLPPRRPPRRGCRQGSGPPTRASTPHPRHGNLTAKFVDQSRTAG